MKKTTVAVMAFLFCGILMGARDVGARDTVRVLSIDGGGVRGMIPAVVLAEMEKELEKPISEIFDLVAGSSSGGLTAISLATPNENGRPKKSGHDLVSMYSQLGTTFFTASLSYRIKVLGGLLGPRYQPDNFQNYLRKELGSTMLSQALVPILITGYHIEGQSGVEFSSEDAAKFPSERDCRMREVARATSAAPTYFDPADVEFDWGMLKSVVDGGLYKNNPALIAYIHAKRLYPGKNIEVYSLGTGMISAEELSAQLKGRGIFEWISPIIQHLQIGDSDGDCAMLHKILNEEGQENFMRLNIKVSRDHKSLDDASAQNVAYLYQRGIAATESQVYKTMIERLKHN